MSNRVFNYKTIIQPINIANVNDDTCNSNNHWKDGIPPIDYIETISKNNTKEWIYKFREYNKIVIKQSDFEWMKKASIISSNMGRFSRLYDDELDEFLKDNSYPDIFNGTKYFVRTENVSLKRGQHGAGPYCDIRKIIESAVSAIKGHTPMESNELIFYLSPWVSIKREFRVFVCECRITAISQQKLYNVLDMGNHQDNVDTIISYFERYIKERITHVSSYSYDFAIIGSNIYNEERPYFIEMNSFGAEYPAGSSLFHWIYDREILYGLTSSEYEIYYRYTTF